MSINNRLNERPTEGLSDGPELSAAGLEQHRPYLMRYAVLQLREENLAEDVVQETFLAALQHGDSFAGRSALKTWLVAILKNKIVDALRKASRDRAPETDSTASSGGAADDEIIDATFGRDARWVEAPASWGTPEQLLRSKQFLSVLEECRKIMPAHQAQVFAMREVLELTVEEICKILDVTTTNCHTTLFRARARLRECLGRRWLRNSERRT